MSSAGDWCLIESDPGVFSELIRGFGVNGIQVEELYSLDDDAFAPLKPILGLVFLFKIDDNYQAASDEQGSLVQDNRLDDIFFAKQVINNACATQAILNLLMNTTAAEHENVSLGDILNNFKDFTKSFDSQTKGLAISNQEELRKVHNSFARHHIFELEDQKSAKDEDLFHFVGYLPINGRLYEFDGLREAPLDHGAIANDWLTSAREVIQKRIDKYASNEIRFNLMALITGLASSNQDELRKVHNSFARHHIFELEDQKSDKDEDLFHFLAYLPINGRLYEFDGLREAPLDHGAIANDWLTSAREVIQKRIDKYASNEIRFNLMALITDRRMKYEQDIAALHAQATDVSLNDDQVIELARLQSLFDAETSKLQQYRIDNVRRRHNYMPLIINLLQVLAEQDKLTGFYQTAQKRSSELRNAQAASDKPV